MANETKQVFGSATTVISHAATLASAANTYNGGSTTMTELDNSSALYPLAQAVLDVPDTFAAAPAIGATVELFMTRNDIDGANDHLPLPAGSSDLKNAEFVGAFPIEDTDEAQRIAIVISLEGVKKANFYVKNVSGQQISYSSNPLTVKVTPFTYAPT